MRRGLAWAGLAMAMTFGFADAAYATYPGPNGKIYISATHPPDGSDVWAVNPDGTGLENVTDTLTDGVGLPDHASIGGVSGDGSRLVVNVDGGVNQEIWAIDADGTAPLRLTNDGNSDSQADISPDGSRVVWSYRGPFDLDRQIWIMNADGTSKQELVHGNPPVIHPVFTPNGQTIVLTTDTAPSLDIGTAPAAPAVPAVNATDLVSIDATDEQVPSVSPDGQSVAFIQDAPGAVFAGGDLLRVGIGGGAVSPLVTNPDVFGRAAFSPDGTKLAYVSDPGSLIVANSDGTNPVPVSLPFAGAGGGIGGNVSWAVGPAVQPPPPPPDTTAPDTAIDKKPKKRSRKRKAVFRFSSSEDGVTFQCRLDKKPFKPCTSPKTYRKLKPGKHRFRVFATDAAGNAEASRNTVTFKVNDIKG